MDPALYRTARLKFSLLAFCLMSLPLEAMEGIPENPEEVQDTWGSVFYCQEIYGESSVKGRVYPGDLQACEKSDALIRWSISSRYSLKDRQVLEQNARNKATAIRYNTASVQEAVQACRQQCRGLASLFDQRVKSGELKEPENQDQSHR
jgi:hypothetical protein